MARGVFGGAGDDTIDVSDDRYLTGEISGGAGDDLITTRSVDIFSTPSQIDGGAGDDTVQSEFSTFGLEVSADDDIGDTVTGGTGADVFALEILNVGGTENVHVGRALTITDFDNDEDTLVIGFDLQNATGFGAELDDFELSEAAIRM